MKTIKLFYLIVITMCVTHTTIFAQATQATNVLNGTQYLGSSNNFDIIFKRNNTPAGLLGPFNTSFGVNALNLSSTGSYNTAVGVSSLALNISGSSNTANGVFSLYYNTTGNYNTAFGYNSLIDNTSGTLNTAIGYGANVGSGNLKHATAVGANAIVTSDSSVQLGSAFVKKVYAGVGANATLIAGKLQITGGTLGAGKVLTSTDATGIATWQTPPTSPWLTSGSNTYYNNGRVGIGTGTPSEKLDVSGNITLSGNVDGKRPNGALAIHANGWSQGGGGIELYGNNHPSKPGYLGLCAGNGTNGNGEIQFNDYNGTSWDVNMVIKNNGNVGIGTETPYSKLHIKGIANETGIISTTTHNADYGYNTLIEVNRNLTKAFAVQNNGVETLRILGDGSLYAQDTWKWSDKRFKKNIQPISNSIGIVKKLNGVSYEVNKELAENPNATGEKSLGFIAQEVETVLPQSVRKDEKGFYAVNYETVIPVLTEAIKEQQKMIEQLQAALQKLGVTLDETKTNNVSDTVRTNELKKETNESSELALPKEFGVESYPNPFNPTTTIKVALPASTKLTVGVYDITGRVVRTIANEQKSAGYYMYEFNGSALSSGTYFIRVQTDAKMEMKKIMLVK